MPQHQQMRKRSASFSNLEDSMHNRTWYDDVVQLSDRVTVSSGLQERIVALKNLSKSLENEVKKELKTAKDVSTQKFNQGKTKALEAQRKWRELITGDEDERVRSATWKTKYLAVNH